MTGRSAPSPRFGSWTNQKKIRSYSQETKKIGKNTLAKRVTSLLPNPPWQCTRYRMAFGVIIFHAGRTAWNVGQWKSWIYKRQGDGKRLTQIRKVSFYFCGPFKYSVCATGSIHTYEAIPHRHAAMNAPLVSGQLGSSIPSSIRHFQKRVFLKS